MPLVELVQMTLPWGGGLVIDLVIDQPCSLALATVGPGAAGSHGGAIAALFVTMLVLVTLGVLRRDGDPVLPLVLVLSGIVMALATAGV